MKSTSALAAAALVSTVATTGALAAPPLDLDFRDGVSGWRTVLDGVMGGRSTGRITQTDSGNLLFTGVLSLENNGGFSQMRRSIPDGSLVGADGVEIRVRGDERSYTFDIRCSDIRLMAGSFQATFEAGSDGWRTIRLPFDSFRLYNFGRQVRNAPPMVDSRIQSIGMTLGDKMEGPFRLEVASIRAYRESDSRSVARSGNDLASVASRAGLTTLLDLVVASGIADDLPADQRLTVLAPTNDAFAALDPAQVRALLTPKGRPLLRTVLAHHVVASALPSADLLDRRSLTSLAGQRIDVAVDATVRLGGARIVATDVAFDGGLVHVIDRVLMPETRTIDEVIAADDRLSTLLAAVSAAGLAPQLGPDNDGPWTILAPTDAAFAALPAGTLETLLQPANRDTLVNILATHVIPGRLYQSDLLGTRTAQALSTEPIAFGLTGGRLTAAGAGFVSVDIPAANGVIHLIDRVIIPSSTAPRSSEPTAGFGEAVALIEQAVEAGAPMFNAGNPAACAAIYRLALTALVDLAPARLGTGLQRTVERALAEGEAERDAQEEAWIYRRAMDAAYERLAMRSDG